MILECKQARAAYGIQQRVRGLLGVARLFGSHQMELKMKTIKLFWAVLLLSIAWPPALTHAQSSLTNGLVAYYPFNGNPYDASGNGFNPVTVEATLCTNRFGDSDQAYSFDGSDSYIGFSATPLTRMANWTLAAWIMPATINQLGYVMNMGADNGANISDGYGLCINAGQLNGVFGGIGYFSSGYTFPVNDQWYHVVMLNNSGLITFYVNGILTPSSYSGTPLTPTAFTIGSATGIRFFDGIIDDVCVYNRALSPTEIEQLYVDGITLNDIVIVNQPGSVTTNQNAVVNFSVAAESNTPLSFQWQFDGFNLAGATNRTLTVTNVQFADTGIYDVVVSNSSNSVPSAAVYLAIAIPGAPAIYVNSNLVTVSATAEGSATITMTSGFTNGLILYTVTGGVFENGNPIVYTGPFTVTNSVYITAVDYSSDFSQSAEMQPLALQVFPFYKLTTSVVGSGGISLDPNTNSFASNSVVALEAVANPGWAFDHWQGSTTHTNNPLTVLVNSNLYLQAVFISTPFALTLTTAGGGTVQASGQTSDGISFPINGIITLTASNYPGWTFLDWQGGVNSTGNPCILIITQSCNVQAVFGTSVMTNATGEGQILLGTSNLIPYGGNVTASAVPDNGEYFVAWGGAAGGTNSPLEATITNSNTTFDALFLPLPRNKLSLSVAILGNGTVDISPQQSYYNPGDSVTLTAVQNDPNGKFYGWMGDVNRTNPVTTVTLYTNLILYANFSGWPPPSPASAIAIISTGSCASVIITSGGYGYTNIPEVTILGGGGDGAAATAVVQNGLVVAVNITNPGNGYTNAPVVLIQPPVILQPQVNIALASQLTFSNLTVSDTYLLQRCVNQNWENPPSGFIATNVVLSQWVNGIATANSYRVVAAPLPTTAAAAALTSYGFVVSATITSGGSGYTVRPAVTILGGGGSGASATATISNGVVTGIIIESAGSGYTNTPTITIAAPPLTSGFAEIQPGILLEMNSLMTNQIYRLQYSTQLNGVWESLGGGDFITATNNLSEYFLMTNMAGYYRLQYLP